MVRLRAVRSIFQTGSYSARLMNLYERHADRVDVATLTDFFGTNWTVNSVIFGAPSIDTPYLLPAGNIAHLYRKSSGETMVALP